MSENAPFPTLSLLPFATVWCAPGCREERYPLPPTFFFRYLMTRLGATRWRGNEKSPRK